MSSTGMRGSGLSVVQQAFALQGRFPEGRGKLKAGRLVFTTAVRPTALSRSYRVQVIYDARRPPTVRVLDELQTREGEVLPHTYVDDTLCLHEAADWTRAMSIADTIVPWASEWLVYYEIWLVTGDWYGGGEWPPRRRLADSNTAEPKEPPAAAAYGHRMPGNEEEAATRLDAYLERATRRARLEALDDRS